MAQKVYSQQHNTVIDCIPGTDCLGNKSRGFSPLKLVSLGKSDALLEKHLAAIFPMRTEKAQTL